ncbi:hypothetical protein KM043_015283 [Ampulex compressa]|nr:hypothetical protein KM043_015283 [Ampulex compressa]
MSNARDSEMRQKVQPPPPRSGATAPRSQQRQKVARAREARRGPDEIERATRDGSANRGGRDGGQRLASSAEKDRRRNEIERELAD